MYDETLRQCLVACKETLKSMVAPLQLEATAAGDENIKHAGWLDQVQTLGVAMTKEQADEIRHAIVKGRPHLEAKMKSQKRSNVPGASGSGAASSSGMQRPHTPRRSPSRNPPVRNPLLPNAQRVPSPRTPPRGAAKRVRSDRDPFAPTVQRQRDEQARAVPSYGHNPTVDFAPPGVIPFCLRALYLLLRYRQASGFLNEYVQRLHVPRLRLSHMQMIVG